VGLALHHSFSALCVLSLQPLFFLLHHNVFFLGAFFTLDLMCQLVIGEQKILPFCADCIEVILLVITAEKNATPILTR
jgi:hypothetical protein